MAAPVWVLSVDLQTKTATFTTGLADAAKSARGSFQDISGGAGAMGGSVRTSMRSTRESVMLLGEEFGVHLPRALTSFIAGLGPVGAAMEMAFPFIAIAALAGILISKLEKMQEAGVKLTQSQLNFGTAAQNVFNSLDEKMLEAQIRADDLADNHMAGLHDQLKLIDMQSMEELVHSFQEVAKAGDVVMKELEGHWYTFGQGSDGAKAALDAFQAKYQSLAAMPHGAAQASELLHGTLGSAREVLAIQERLRDIKADKHSSAGEDREGDQLREQLRLKKAGTEATDNEVAAQENLVDILQATVGAEQRAADIKALDQKNAKIADAKADDRTEAETARKAAAEQKTLSAEMLDNIRQSDQDAIAATVSGSSERLAAIQHAMDETRELYGEDSHVYKQFAAEYLKTTEQMDKQLLDVDAAFTKEQAHQAQEAGDEEARHGEAMAERMVSLQKSAFALINSVHRSNAAALLAQDTLVANEEYAIKYVALAKQIDALDRTGADYDNKLKALQNKEKELVQQHEDAVTAIKEKAEQERNSHILAAEQQLGDSISRELTQTLMGHQSFAKMMNQLGNEVVSGMIANSIKIMLQQDKERMGDAKKAATSAYATGEKIGGPAGIILGPVFAAAAFAGVMAFAGGGIVPGVGGVDSVPSMLTPGEGIVPRGVMDQLGEMARNGGLQNNGPHYIVHVRPTYHVNTIDGAGMEEALKNHTDVLQKHFENAVRRMNH